MALFDKLHQKGNTIVLVTHEHDISEYAHRVISIRDGKVESDRSGAGGGDGFELIAGCPVLPTIARTTIHPFSIVDSRTRRKHIVIGGLDPLEQPRIDRDQRPQ